ncbi:hypothetical protein ILYODFUR_013294, partial [Ilyodon furcidens]
MEKTREHAIQERQICPKLNFNNGKRMLASATHKPLALFTLHLFQPLQAESAPCSGVSFWLDMMPGAFWITPVHIKPLDTSIESAGRAGGCQLEAEVLDFSVFLVKASASVGRQ